MLIAAPHSYAVRDSDGGRSRCSRACDRGIPALPMGEVFLCVAVADYKDRNEGPEQAGPADSQGCLLGWVAV